MSESYVRIRGVRTVADILAEFSPAVAYTLAGITGANDNLEAASRITRHISGNFAKDCLLLQKKWAMGDKAYMAWCASFPAYSVAIGSAMQEVAREKGGGTQPVLLAAAIGAIHLMAGVLGQLEDQEAIIALNRLNEITNEVVNKLTNEGKNA